jgi:acetyl-CoA carboxylase, biotin carboxylase subunit
MFQKILVANRGEIACRVMATCHEMKIPTVAIYSEADRDSLHVHMAEEAVCVGPPPNRASYLNIPNIISAAVITGADAIHPGYGNLSEIARFAEICDACKLSFIGPPAEVIDLLGDKVRARQVAIEADVPVIPGSQEEVTTPAAARRLAQELGYPVLLKAVAGGGGRGIRDVHNDEQMNQAFDTAQSEALAAFGDDRIYVDKFIPTARHVEVQILADRHGNVVHLGERDCSIQIRRQKILEEAPAPGVSRSLQRRLGEAAVRLAQAAGYVGAGTVEFLLDPKGKFFFLEANARIQVEHPVTEMLTGIDIVQEQIRAAAGEKLSCEQGSIWFHGHAIECRVLAVDPSNDLAPSPGTITEWVAPVGPGIRVDSGVAAGSVVPGDYDPMIAKVVVWARDRNAAIARMESALRSMRVSGIQTIIPMHLRILGNRFFRDAQLDTLFVPRRLG